MPISDSTGSSSRSVAERVTCERWLCAPYSEMFFEHGHRLVTGTSTFIVTVVTPAFDSARSVTR